MIISNPKPPKLTIKNFQTLMKSSRLKKTFFFVLLVLSISSTIYLNSYAYNVVDGNVYTLNLSNLSTEYGMIDEKVVTSIVKNLFNSLFIPGQ